MINTEYACLVEDSVKQTAIGSFLMSGREKVNPMTIGWAQWGVIWGKPICTVLVRKSRYSHELIEKDGFFTVSVPACGEMKDELTYCGRKSGRDEDKLRASNLSLLTPKNSQAVPPLKGCAIHFECRVVFKTESDLSCMDKEMLKKYYGENQAAKDGDPHTVYFGEILAAYRT